MGRGRKPKGRIKWDKWTESKRSPGTYLRSGRKGTGREGLVYHQHRHGTRGTPEYH